MSTACCEDANPATTAVEPIARDGSPPQTPCRLHRRRSPAVVGTARRTGGSACGRPCGQCRPQAALNRQGVFRRGGVSLAILVRRGVCLPAGESRRSSRAGDGGCDGPGWWWPGEPGRAGCRGGWRSLGCYLPGMAWQASGICGSGIWCRDVVLWWGWDGEVPVISRGRIASEFVRCPGVRGPAQARPEGVRGPLAGRGLRQVPVVHDAGAGRQLPRRAGPRGAPGPGFRPGDR